jgi:hypothetical protein
MDIINKWSNGLTHWIEKDIVYISVVFSWYLKDAYNLASYFKNNNQIVRAGGPGLFSQYHRQRMSEVSELGGEVNALIHHNVNATIASRGCTVGCYFCIVPKMEGKTFTLIPEFIPKPMLCDNNLSALPTSYQNFIIDKYQKYAIKLLDINSGFEPKTFDSDTYNRWNKIYKGIWRFGYDETKEENYVYRMTQLLKDIPGSKKRIYVLIGNEPFEDCYRRVMQVIQWGCEPHVQPMIPNNALTKIPIVNFDWTERKLIDLSRWSNRFIWRKTKYEDYKYDYHK